MSHFFGIAAALKHITSTTPGPQPCPIVVSEFHEVWDGVEVYFGPTSVSYDQGLTWWAEGSAEARKLEIRTKAEIYFAKQREIALELAR